MESETNFDMAGEYIRRLTGDENTPVTFQVFDDTPAKDPGKARVYHGTLKEHFNRLTADNDNGCGIFCTVNESNGGRKHADITRVRAILADDDDGLNRVDGFPLRPHMAVLSSRSGAIEKKHFYWCCVGKLDEYDGVINRLVQDYKTCAGAKGLNRVLRLPGFYHKKDPANPQLVEIIHMTDAEPYSWAQIVKAFPPVGNGHKKTNKLHEAFNSDPVLIQLRAGGFVKKENPDGRIHIICPFEESHTETSSASATTYFVAHTNGYKFGHFKCQHAHCAERTREDFLQAIGYATRGTAEELVAEPEAEPDQRRVLCATSLLEISSEKIEARPLAEGFIDEEEKIVFHGEGGCKKSLLTLNLAAVIASGQSILWDKFPVPRPLNFLFIQSENGRKSLNERARKMVQGNPELAKGFGNIFFAGIDGGVELAGAVSEKTFREDVYECAKATGAKIDCISFDPLISNHDADENDNSRMRTTLDWISEIAATIGADPFVIHHDNRMGSLLIVAPLTASTLVDCFSIILAGITSSAGPPSMVLCSKISIRAMRLFSIVTFTTAFTGQTVALASR
jgi:hypothetical protein